MAEPSSFAVAAGFPSAIRHPGKRATASVVKFRSRMGDTFSLTALDKRAIDLTAVGSMHRPMVRDQDVANSRQAATALGLNPEVPVDFGDPARPKADCFFNITLAQCMADAGIHRHPPDPSRPEPKFKSF